MRDFDIVIEDAAIDDVRRALRFYNETVNRFGGSKYCIGGVDIDIWPLSSTWAFRQNLICDVSFESLPKTTFLNIDSIVVEVAPKPGKARRIYESGFFRAIRSGELDICLRENPHPDLCVVRTLRLAEGLGFRLSLELAKYVAESIDSGRAANIEQAQMSRYGNVFFGAPRLKWLSRAIWTAIERNGDAQISLFPSSRRQAELWEIDSVDQFRGWWRAETKNVTLRNIQAA